MAFEKVDEILEKHGYRHDALIGIIQDIQRLENYLPLETLRHISHRLEIPLSRIYYIATFYKSFSLEPRGRHIVKVCLGTACHICGATQNLEQMERTLHICEGETTKDMMFSLETVNCVGTCALAPVAIVDDTYYDAVTPEKVEKILSNYATESEGIESEKN
ncbi:MAG: NAD(P)H-dependent oxidoreductase subunit E [Desulfobacteraceae bacterium]|uniref:NAD(P)H-dependent oxidoreductase subunit E n=1 Tax=Candidatus Desulfacyla euxinica TaxID=2841693 RepID=A0A8J6N2Y4_9DELT|nr:NAD(P)H-dependent oxidoreductase subunit E [Candidatus Desulfacyla euxinica]MBL6979226.1 NAD(P)H-dependent oxidoreductase subunit E [Desulfobacteraceae bacterium]MBL7217856.1 NAD(P)H-dependent oxidoreductase subunit E [Desulfobacteraceae bacterium]